MKEEYKKSNDKDKDKDKDKDIVLIVLVVFLIALIGGIIIAEIYDRKNTTTKEEVMILKRKTIKMNDKKMTYTFEKENKEEIVYECEEEIVCTKSSVRTNTAFYKSVDNMLEQGKQYKVKYSIYKNKVTKVIEVTEL